MLYDGTFMKRALVLYERQFTMKEIKSSLAILAALPLTTQYSQAETLTASLVHQFAPVRWIENLGIRPNGNILPIFSVGTGADLNQIDAKSGKVELVHDFSNVGNSIQSIVEMQKDLFVIQVLTCNWTALSCTKGTASIWSVDFRPSDRDGSSGHGKRAVVVKEVTAFPDAGQLNGAAALNDHVVVFSDSILGALWSLDITSGVKQLLFTDESFMPTATAGSGINGIRIVPGLLYFQNSALGTLNSIPIDPASGNRAGNPVIIAKNLSTPDDFEIAEIANGRAKYAYVAEGTGGPNSGGQVTKIDLATGAKLANIAVPGPTSVRMGKRGKLYSSTVGGLMQYLAGNVTVGGAVWQISG